MRKFFWPLGVILLLIMSTTIVSASSNNKVTVLVSFKDKVSANLIEASQGKIKSQLKGAPVVIAELPQKALDALSKHKDIEFIEEDGVWAAQEQNVPWGVDHIEADLVQERGINGAGVTVAVLDSGTSTHEDINVTGGWNFINNSSNYTDIFGHGTHVAGIIAARNNTLGVVGVSPEVELYSLKVLDDRGNANWSTIVKALDWVISNKIKIVNMSFGGTSGSKTIEKFINKAYSSGILLVASAGNNSSQPVTYPAKYENVIAVGAIDQRNSICSFSSTGPEVEIVAPGYNILSTYRGNSYTVMSGTSMAAPHLAGAAALVWSNKPTLNNVQIRTILDKAVVDLGTPGRDSVYGYGLLDVNKAIQ